MLTTLYRIFKYGLQYFTRNFLVSFATVLVLLLAVVVFEGLIISGYVGQQIVSIVKDKIDISVDFSENVPEDEMLRLKRSLEDLKEVKAVQYISKDDALTRFKEKHPENSDVSKALEELGGANPLRASLNIKAKDPRDYSAIAAYLSNDSLKSTIENVSYNKNQVVIDRLVHIMDVGSQAGLFLTIILAAVASIVSFNTILLAIYANKDEISIMRLVGASNAFIRGPYIIVGALYGLVAALVGIIVIAPVVYLIAPSIAVLVPDLNLWGYFIRHSFTILGNSIFFAVTIGVVSSYVVVRRYLVG